MAERTEEALDRYARQVLLDALRAEWEDTGQEDAFAPSRKYRNEMRELAANPEAWYRRKTEPPWRKYVRRFSAIAALIAVCVIAVWFLPDGGGTTARMTFVDLLGALFLALPALIYAVVRIGTKHKK